MVDKNNILLRSFRFYCHKFWWNVLNIYARLLVLHLFTTTIAQTSWLCANWIVSLCQQVGFLLSSLLLWSTPVVQWFHLWCRSSCVSAFIYRIGNQAKNTFKHLTMYARKVICQWLVGVFGQFLVKNRFLVFELKLYMQTISF